MGNSVKPTLWTRLKAAFWGMPTRNGRTGGFVANIYGVNATYNEWNNKSGIDAYSTNAALYAIINRITKTAAIAPFQVFRIKDQKKHYKYRQWTGENATTESLHRAMMMKDMVYVEDNEHELNILIDKPNQYCSGQEFIINSVGFKLLTGNRLWRKNILDIGKNKGRPQELELLPPQFMQVIPDGTMNGVKGYRLRMGGVELIFDKEEIVHSKYFNPNYDSFGSHLWGMSPLMPASKNITRAESGLDRSVAMLQNAGAAGLLFNKTGESYTEDQARQMKNKLNSEILGVDNSQKIGLANGDLGYINFGLTAVEMNIIELEKYSWEQICDIYAVPPGLFQPDKMSLNNAKEFKKELITSAVLPELNSLRDDWNEIAKLYGDDTIYVDYDPTVYPELQEDTEKLARVMSTAWWFTPNEKRIAMGQDEDSESDMMDKYLVPNNLIDIETVGMDNTGDLMNEMDNEDGTDTTNSGTGDTADKTS